MTEVTELISVAPDGAAANAASFLPKHSNDGRYVVFRSNASNLVPNDNNGRPDIFLRDRLTGVTDRIIVSDETVGDFATLHFAISGDGSKVIFESIGSNFVAHDTNGLSDVFIYDIATKVTSRVSNGLNNANANGRSYNASISGDGRWVAYVSEATNLVAGDTNNSPDVFVFDTILGITERVSISSLGEQSHQIGANTRNWDFRPAISEDGRFVAFKSLASNLVQNDFNGAADIFVRDRLTARTSRVSISSEGAERNGSFGYPTISDNGRFVAFRTTSHFAANEPNAPGMIAIRDQLNGTTETLVFSSPFPGLEASYPLLFHRFDGESTLFTYAARMPLWTDLNTGQVQAWQRNDGIRANAPVLNHTTIIDHNPPLRATAEKLLYGDILVLNSLVSKPSFEYPATFNAQYSTRRGSPLYASTVFVDSSNFSLGESLDNLLHYKIPFEEISQLPKSVFFSLEHDQLGQARPTRQALGAIEITGASIEGTVFVDANGNGALDAAESGLSGITVFIDYNGNSILDHDEPFAVTKGQQPGVPGQQRAGSYLIENVRQGKHSVVPILAAEQQSVMRRFEDQIPARGGPWQPWSQLRRPVCCVFI